MYMNASDGNPDDKIRAMRRQIYQKNKDVINARKRELYEIKQTGGHYYTDKESDSKNDRLAARAYEQYSRSDDSKKIAKVSGFTIQEVQRIRSHVFFKKHDLFDGRYDRFDPSYDMAVAWKRLSEGKPIPRDITLLHHELFESEMEQKYNISASEAHRIADQKYSWYDQLMRETEGAGEPDGIL